MNSEDEAPEHIPLVETAEISGTALSSVLEFLTTHGFQLSVDGVPPLETQRAIVDLARRRCELVEDHCLNTDMFSIETYRRISASEENVVIVWCRRTFTVTMEFPPGITFARQNEAVNQCRNVAVMTPKAERLVDGPYDDPFVALAASLDMIAKHWPPKVATGEPRSSSVE